MKTEVTGNTLEVAFSRVEAVSVALTVVLAVVLLVFAGWEITVVALGMSFLGAGMVDLVQRSDLHGRRWQR